MKFRKDFVTNSSSSSYVCEICGNTESGFDISLSDTDMVQCENGHTICEIEMLPGSREDLSDDRLLMSYADVYYNARLEEDDFRYSVDERFCPICQFIEYSQSDLAKYLEKKYKVSRDEVFEKIKQFNKRRKKLYDSEYVTEVCTHFNLNPAEIVAGLKDEFGSYRRFIEYLTGGF